MRKGFFGKSKLKSKTIKPGKSSAACGKCGMYKTCKNPKLAPTGEGQKRILIVADFPGVKEDNLGENLVGREGNFIRRKLRKFGIEPDVDCWMTSAVRCKPPKTTMSSDGKPPISKAQTKNCHPNLHQFILDNEPHLILLFGNEAVRSVIAEQRGNESCDHEIWRGWHIPDRQYKAWICPMMPHWYYDMKSDDNPAVDKIFNDDLKTALDKLNEELPYFIHQNEEDKIHILKHDDDINDYLHKLILCERSLIAFDYETTGIKPQSPQQEIVTCAISTHPDTAVAFPYSSEVHDNWIKLMHNKHIKKVGANIKFEHNWSTVKVGTIIRGWYFDTMLASHCLDNRPKITSMDFQSYVNFGIADYDSHIKKFLKADGGGNSINRIKDLPMKDLLVYNGMDAMLELRLGMLQMDKMGIEYKHLMESQIGTDFTPTPPVKDKIRRRKRRCK